MITFDDFKKVDLQVAQVRSCQRVEGSEKLLRLELDDGADGRQIIAGVGTRYECEDMEGRLIIIVANLAPREIMGLESQGMLLAADTPEGPVLLLPDGEVVPGTKIR